MTTSHVIAQIARQLRAGRHPLVVGNIGDLALLKGQPLPLVEALCLVAQSAFQLVIRLNAVDGLQIVHGRAHFDAICADLRESRDDIETDGPEDRPARSTVLGSPPPLREDPLTITRRCLTQQRVSTAVIIEQADILLQDPALHDERERRRVAGLQLALRDAARVGRYRNTCFLLAGDRAAIPRALLVGSDAVATVDVTAPTHAEREAFLATVVDSMHGAADLDDRERSSAINELARQTDGDSLRNLESLAAFSAASRIAISAPRDLIAQHRRGERPDYWGALLPAIEDCRRLLSERVFSQDHAVDAAVRILAAGALGLRLTGDRHSSEGQPRGVLWFVGPTGVGKTELAKAIALAVFGDEEAYVRFDMTTFKEQHAAERLFGSPPGFVGFEQGGELSNAVRRRPNSVILFDEIEKAHIAALDRLMSVLDDGRVVDAQGREAYFSESIIVFTSNLGSKEVARLVAERGWDVPFELIEEITLAAVTEHFASHDRAALLGRIKEGIVPFDVLRPAVADLITEKILAAASFDNGPELQADVPSWCRFAHLMLADENSRALGGRQIRNVVQLALQELAMWIALNGHGSARQVDVWFEATTMLASVDGGSATVVKTFR